MAASKLRKERLEHDGYKCCNCGEPATQVHHVVPEAIGGFDTLTNLVSLCDDCHSRVHGSKAVDLSALTKSALAAAKARGVVVGRPSIDRDSQDLIRRLRGEGMSYREVAEASGIKLATVFKYGR